MSAHTSGPWRVLADTIPYARKEAAFVVETEAGALVAVLPFERHDIEAKAEALPDARLISAAPELAEAPVDLLQSFGVATDDGLCHSGITTKEKCRRCSRILAAEAALDKAGIE